MANNDEHKSYFMFCAHCFLPFFFYHLRNGKDMAVKLGFAIRNSNSGKEATKISKLSMAKYISTYLLQIHKSVQNAIKVLRQANIKLKLNSQFHSCLAYGIRKMHFMDHAHEWMNGLLLYIFFLFSYHFHLFHFMKRRNENRNVISFKVFDNAFKKVVRWMQDFQAVFSTIIAFIRHVQHTMNEESPFRLLEH